MTVCHIINPPLTHITNQCLPRHHLLTNTNPNPNLSFSLFRTNPLRSRHIPQPPRPCPITTAHAGKPPPVVPSSETSPVAATRRSSWASSSSCIPLPEPPFSNQPRRHSLRRPRSLLRHRRHTCEIQEIHKN